ncbi:MAG: hypothetical protein ACYCW6_15300, partial [Candidatus Xenobia bacterium]
GAGDGLPASSPQLRAELASGLHAVAATQGGLEPNTREHLEPLMFLLREGYQRALKALDADDRPHLDEALAMLDRAFKMAASLGER